MYDLSRGLARTLAPVLGSWFTSEDFEGIWHSGVVVFGQEYYFNGDLVHIDPGETVWGKPTKVMTIGHTPCTQKELHQFVVDELRAAFSRESYDALNNNCNHFSDRLCLHLCNRHIPDHVLQQPERLAKLPALRLLRPILDQCLGSGLQGSVGDPGLESATTEAEPLLSNPARRTAHRHAEAPAPRGSIVRGGSVEREGPPGAGSSPDACHGRRPVASPCRASRDADLASEDEFADVREELKVAVGRRHCAEVTLEGSPVRQPCWPGCVGGRFSSPESAELVPIVA